MSRYYAEEELDLQIENLEFELTKSHNKRRIKRIQRKLKWLKRKQERANR